MTARYFLLLMLLFYSSSSATCAVVAAEEPLEENVVEEFMTKTHEAQRRAEKVKVLQAKMVENTTKVLTLLDEAAESINVGGEHMGKVQNRGGIADILLSIQSARKNAKNTKDVAEKIKDPVELAVVVLGRAAAKAAAIAGGGEEGDVNELKKRNLTRQSQCGLKCQRQMCSYCQRQPTPLLRKFRGH